MSKKNLSNSSRQALGIRDRWRSRRTIRLLVADARREVEEERRDGGGGTEYGGSSCPTTKESAELRQVSIRRDIETYRRLAPLYSTIQEKTDREALAEVAQGLADNPSLDVFTRSRLVDASALDSWDKSRLDGPDYEKRHGALANLEKV